MGITRYPGKSSWSVDLPIALPGGRAMGLFDLYPSKGDVTIATLTTIPGEEDGPIVVAAYDKLTLNASLTRANCGKGLIVLCKSLLIGAVGHVHMDGMAPRVVFNDDPRFPFSDITIPQRVLVSGRSFSQSAFLAWLASSGIFIGDMGFWNGLKSHLGDVKATITPGDVPLVSAAGCGQGGTPGSSSTTSVAGSAGGAGTNGGTGGGAGGGAIGGGNTATSGAAGAPGNPYGGGLGGGTGYCYGQTRATSPLYSGVNGVGSTVDNNARPGGMLAVICLGDVSIAAGGKVSANAIGSATSPFGGPGGGSATLIYGGTLTNNGSITANGGTMASPGNIGGAGSARAIPFSAMGWT